MSGWGPGPQQGFMNALAIGQNAGANFMQAFQQGRQMKEQREYKNALAQFDPMKPETLQPIMAVRPDVGMQLRGQVQAQQAAAREIDVKRRAAAGDPSAVAELAGIDWNAWSGLKDDQKAAAKQSVDAMGQAALLVASAPPEQRAAAWDQQIEALSQRYPDLAQYRGRYSEQSLQSAIAQAGQFNQFWQMTRPEAFNVEPGAGRYQRDPATGRITTIIEPNLGGAPAFSPVTPSGGAKPAPVAKQVGDATYYQNPETGQWFDNPQEAMGGGGSDATGSFLGS